MTPEEIERRRLLERIPEYVHEYGIAGLRVDRVAAWLGMPVAQFQEYFAHDTDLITALVARNRLRLREGYARLRADESLTQRQVRQKMWESYLGAADDSALFFEAYGLALHDETYGAFLHGVNDWLDLMIESMTTRAVAPGRATAFATLTLAAYRGAMLDFCATGDRARINAAMEIWLDIADQFDRL